MTEPNRYDAAPAPSIPADEALGWYLRAYRGNLTLQEAARRSGLPEARWERLNQLTPGCSSRRSTAGSDSALAQIYVGVAFLVSLLLAAAARVQPTTA